MRCVITGSRIERGDWFIPSVVHAEKGEQGPCSMVGFLDLLDDAQGALLKRRIVAKATGKGKAKGKGALIGALEVEISGAIEDAAVTEPDIEFKPKKKGKRKGSKKG